jgi:hypothetical protein
MTPLATQLGLIAPLILIVAVFGFAWDDMCRFLNRKLDEANQLLDDPQDGPPLRPEHRPPSAAVVERRPSDRERARRERAEARTSRPLMEARRRSAR